MELTVCVFDTEKGRAEAMQRYVAAVLFNADYRSRVMSCTTDAALRRLTLGSPSVDLLFLPADPAWMAFGEELRRSNRTTTIVFLSGDGTNVYRAFRSLPIAYLTDTSDKGRLSETILAASAWAMSGKRVFCHESRTQLLQLRYEDIDYFESEYRLVHIYRSDGSHETITAKLDEIEALLPSGSFCRCHKSYLVNLEHIASVNKSEKAVLLRSGARVFSSKAQFPALIAALKGDAFVDAV